LVIPVQANKSIRERAYQASVYNQTHGCMPPYKKTRRLLPIEVSRWRREIYSTDRNIGHPPLLEEKPKSCPPYVSGCSKNH